MKKVVSFLRDSNISEYTNIMSSEDVIKSLLESQAGQQSAQTTFVDETIKDNNELIKILADVFQSLTTKAMTTREIIEYIYDNYKPELGIDVNEELYNFLGDSIKIVHANNYKLNCKNKDISTLRHASPFILTKTLPEAIRATKDKKGKWIEKPYYYYMLSEDAKRTNISENDRFGLSQIIKNLPDNMGDIKLEFAKKSDGQDTDPIF
ncbi:MAG: hypothetical protein EBY39_10190, partial [Flavobacteriia bacterium]|nr:hypothetical protein [Flavobacteriia bacterium]